MTSVRAPNYDYLIKLLLIGDSGVGKSCLLLRFCDDAFTPSFITTVGIDFKIKTVELDGKRAKLQIWDTAGQERFKTITNAYYRTAMGVLLVYDVTDERSFQNIHNWFKNVEQHANDGVMKVLVGNKSDNQEKRTVSYQQGKWLADHYGMKFVETSAKTSSNVENVFINLSREVKKKLDDGLAAKKQSSNVNLSNGQDSRSNGSMETSANNRAKCCTIA